jgi:hypothetical protein
MQRPAIISRNTDKIKPMKCSSFGAGSLTFRPNSRLAGSLQMLFGAILTPFWLVQDDAALVEDFDPEVWGNDYNS